MKLICTRRSIALDEPKNAHQGETPHDMLVRLYQEELKSHAYTFLEWKQRNSILWKTRYNVNVSIGNDPHSEHTFLECLLNLRKIESIPSPH